MAVNHRRLALSNDTVERLVAVADERVGLFFCGGRIRFPWFLWFRERGGNLGTTNISVLVEPILSYSLWFFGSRL